jgi:hypothetical protein
MNGRVVIPGGSGHCGTILAAALWRDGRDVVVLSRSPRPAPWRVAAWDGRTPGEWESEIDGADAVIHLSGRSVDCRYDERNRREILDSRVVSTHAIGAAIGRARVPPRVWLQASTATIYAHRYDAANDETIGILGGSEPGAPDTWNFSIEVARAWEAAADETVLSATRRVLMRTAMVMSPRGGGAFEKLLRLVRFGLGGRAGDGRQYVSWIHDVDFVAAVRLLLRDDALSGIVNLAAPGPLPNAEFMRILRQAYGRHVGLPAPRSLTELGALLLRTESELILKSRRVISTRLPARGFVFSFPEWWSAAAELCARRRAQQGAPPRRVRSAA